MELMKRDFLTITDDGESICMSLDTTHEDVQKVGKKMAAIRTGLLKYYLDANNPALLKDLIWNSEGNDLKAYYKKTSAFTRAKGISLGKYVMTLFGEAEGKGLYCVIRDEGDFIDW